MSATRDILDGIATMISANLPIAWSGLNVAPAPTVPVIAMKFMPTDPDRVVVLNVVPQGDDITMPLGQVMIQVRGRGARNNPLDVDDTLDPIFDLLHGTTNLVFGATTLVQLNRRTSVPMGVDELKRHERVDQYYADVAYPPTANRPAGGSW